MSQEENILTESDEQNSEDTELVQRARAFIDYVQNLPSYGLPSTMQVSPAMYDQLLKYVDERAAEGGTPPPMSQLSVSQNVGDITHVQVTANSQETEARLRDLETRLEEYESGRRLRWRASYVDLTSPVERAIDSRLRNDLDPYVRRVQQEFMNNPPHNNYSMGVSIGPDTSKEKSEWYINHATGEMALSDKIIDIHLRHNYTPKHWHNCKACRFICTIVAYSNPDLEPDRVEAMDVYYCPKEHGDGDRTFDVIIRYGLSDNDILYCHLNERHVIQEVALAWYLGKQLGVIDGSNLKYD